MDERAPHRDQEQLLAVADPVGWINLQEYGDLKRWLKNAIWRGDWAPLIVPPSSIPISYLAQTLLRADMRVKTDLRSIVPELLSEWNAHDSREVLESLLILCGDLTCSEAEMIIARIIVHKLGEEDQSDIRCRSRALSTLQSIGTERTLHLFLRYISYPRHAALCYRGLYQLNPAYAATQLPGLIRSYMSRNATESLIDVLDLLFNETLTPPEYITVLLPFAEQAAPESFSEALELLSSIGVFDEPFLSTLSPKQVPALFGEILKRAPDRDCEKIVEQFGNMGLFIEPQPDALENDSLYYLVWPTGESYQRWPLVKSSDLEGDKAWKLVRSYNDMPQIIDLLAKEAVF